MDLQHGEKISQLLQSKTDPPQAATALMVPIVDSVCEAMFESDDVELEERRKPRERSKVQEVKRNLMLLSCAYAANIGGTGVITGTPPNLVVLSQLDKDYTSKGGKTSHIAHHHQPLISPLQENTR